MDDSTLHYHLNKLIDVGLVEKRQRTERGQDGLSTYYRATVFGEVTLTKGVDEQIHGEQAFDEMYDSSTEDWITQRLIDTPAIPALPGFTSNADYGTVVHKSANR